MAETPYGNVPDMNQYKRFQSDEELLASIKSGVVNYANSGYLDPNYLRAPIDIIAKNAVPYEKPLQDLAIVTRQSKVLLSLQRKHTVD
jgi:hypothetical protein